MRHREDDGEIDVIVHLPVPNPTCVQLGGANMDTLYITTTQKKMSEADLEAMPMAGSLFAVKVPVKGVAEPKFGGTSL